VLFNSDIPLPQPYLTVARQNLYDRYAKMIEEHFAVSLQSEAGHVSNRMANTDPSVMSVLQIILEENFARLSELIGSASVARLRCVILVFVFFFLNAYFSFLFQGLLLIDVLPLPPGTIGSPLLSVRAPLCFFQDVLFAARLLPTGRLRPSCALVAMFPSCPDWISKQFTA
jgi:hypothetical protein